MAPSERSDRPEERWLERMGRYFVRIASKVRRRPSRRAERLLLAAAFLAFFIAGIAAAWNFPPTEQDIRWGLLVAAGLLMSANIALNAAEFHIIGRFIGQRVPAVRAIKVTILGSAANLLPVPGSTLVRVQALVADRARYGDAIGASIAVGVLSVGANLLVAGLAMLYVASLPTSLGLVGAGLFVAVAALGVIAMLPGRSRRANRVSWAAFGVEVVYASVSAIRLWLIFLGLGLDVALPYVFALTAAGSLATAVGFFPAGLGIRELLIGAISPLVGLAVSVGLAGAVVERLLWFLVLAVAAAAIFLRTGTRPSAWRLTDSSRTPAGPEPPT